ncbi:MAG: energy-coupling factor ABC transporter ATP-binding protein [Propionibacteriaceae bacterium]
MICCTDVVFSVPVVGAEDRILLQQTTCTLTEQRIAVVGSNGSGKSTFLRLFNGLRLPTQGSVDVNGLDTRTHSSEVRQQVGFTFADPLAQLVLATPAEDIALSLRRSIRNKTQRRARAQELLDERGLGKLADQSIYDLSGGERQLVALTSVLAVEPKILVSDEPTTLLDLRNRRMVIEALLEVPQQLIVATHDLDFAAGFDRALFLDGGQIAADGDPAEVIDFYRRRVLS